MKAYIISLVTLCICSFCPMNTTHCIMGMLILEKYVQYCGFLTFRIIVLLIVAEC